MSECGAGGRREEEEKHLPPNEQSVQKALRSFKEMVAHSWLFLLRCVMFVRKIFFFSVGFEPENH